MSLGPAKYGSTLTTLPIGKVAPAMKRWRLKRSWRVSGIDASVAIEHSDFSRRIDGGHYLVPLRGRFRTQIVVDEVSDLAPI